MGNSNGSWHCGTKYVDREVAHTTHKLVHVQCNCCAIAHGCYDHHDDGMSSHLATRRFDLPGSAVMSGTNLQKQNISVCDFKAMLYLGNHIVTGILLLIKLYTVIHNCKLPQANSSISFNFCRISVMQLHCTSPIDTQHPALCSQPAPLPAIYWSQLY